MCEYVKAHIYLPEWMTSDYKNPSWRANPTEPMHLRCSCKCNISLSLMHVRLSFKHSLTQDYICKYSNEKKLLGLTSLAPVGQCE
ncbi:uncharacterized protein Dyak_GE28902 [Drosophila yakuba]|uniref:Uncharacterized protein n=1 Tax=Drosophila yakuba TaxID=7245 RepID=A0A0R1E728_DROYA|nr:uncharacterized protein Dyak_GE28902 [Drosophila yakuba]